jgi:quercetin dioxygenase-like cupin family protein
MDSTAFTTELKASGFDDVAEKHCTANFTSDPHSHEFAVRGLVIAGEFILTKDGTAATYRTGDTFEMDANCVHSEASGAEGSVYLVGRKHPH